MLIILLKHIKTRGAGKGNKEALMVYHQTRASALANTNVTYSLCEVIDEAGNVLIKEYTKAAAE